MEEDSLEDSLVVDCGRCAVRGSGCADCAVSVLLNPPPTIEWDQEELRAIEVLAEGGLVPGLKLVPMGQVQRERAA